MKRRNAKAALIAALIWAMVLPVVVLATSQDALLDGNDKPTLTVENANKDNTVLRVKGATGSMYVTITGGGLATNTLAISPVATFSEASVDIQPGALGLLDPVGEACSFILDTTSTQTMQFSINASATVASPYLRAGSTISWGDSLKVTKVTIWNSGTVKITAKAMFGHK